MDPSDRTVMGGLILVNFVRKRKHPAGGKYPIKVAGNLWRNLD